MKDCPFMQCVFLLFCISHMWDGILGCKDFPWIHKKQIILYFSYVFICLWIAARTKASTQIYDILQPQDIGDNRDKNYIGITCTYLLFLCS